VEPPGAPRRIGYLYLLPGLAVYAAFVLAPLGHTIWLSLHQWDGLTPATWVGLDNYREIVNDPELRSAFEHSLVLIVFYAVIPVTLALVLVGALSRARVRGQAGFRTVLFLPQVIPLVVVAVIWRMIYAPDDGPLNRLLRGIGSTRSRGRGSATSISRCPRSARWDLGDVGTSRSFCSWRACRRSRRASTTPRASTAPDRCASSSP
jgi:ABC-type sugar transport system permease subunit